MSAEEERGPGMARVVGRGSVPKAAMVVWIGLGTHLSLISNYQTGDGRQGGAVWDGGG